MKEIMRVVLRSNIISDYLKGLRAREIRKKYNVSSRMVSYWVGYYKKKKAELNEINRQLNVKRERIERAERSLRGERGQRNEITIQQKEMNLEKQILEDLSKMDLTRKKRKGKVTRIPHKIQQYLYKQFADKRTGGKEGRSIRKVIAKANKKFKLKDPKKCEGKINQDERRLTFGTVQRFLVMKFGKARKLIKKPLLRPSHISQRKAFAEYIVKNEIDFKKIFFTDEKRFVMNFVPNKQTNQIRLSKLTQRKLKQNNQEVEKLLTIPVEKNPKGVMVAGGVSYYGVGKLNFIVGAMDSCAYAQTLENYKKDIEYYKSIGVDLIFQQDNSPSHVSAEIKQILDGMHRLDFWPPNSPDLSPIECVWAEVQAKLEGYSFKSMDDFKKKIIYEWNRVPIEYCQRICQKFIDDINQIYKFGRVKDKQHISKGLIFKKTGVFSDKIENIVYNKYSLKNVIKYNIKELEKNNKKLKSIIYKLKSSKFKNKIKADINVESFKNIYKEIIKENEDIYYNNKKEIHKLAKMPLSEYFNSLTHKQKIKICNLAARYNDEFKNEGRKKYRVYIDKYDDSDEEEENNISINDSDSDGVNVSDSDVDLSNIEEEKEEDDKVIEIKNDKENKKTKKKKNNKGKKDNKQNQDNKENEQIKENKESIENKENKTPGSVTKEKTTPNEENKAPVPISKEKATPGEENKTPVFITKQKQKGGQNEGNKTPVFITKQKGAKNDGNKTPVFVTKEKGTQSTHKKKASKAEKKNNNSKKKENTKKQNVQNIPVVQNVQIVPNVLNTQSIEINDSDSEIIEIKE